MPSFFAARSGDRAVIEGADARHLARSLRARVGEEVDVIDPAGKLLSVRLDLVSTDRVEGVIVAERDHRPEPAARITLAIANLPAPALELALSRCTEVGAFAFTVFQADRSVARGAKIERWTTICREAAMLAGRLRVPEVATARSLAQVVETLQHPVLLQRTATMSLAGLTTPRDLTLCIGPEGGWTEAEAALVKTQVSLGPRNLQAGTAAIVALGVALAARE